MRTVPGRTDRVIVVGAGLAGLSAALRLAGAGREVTVLERESFPGGRAGIREMTAPDGGRYRFDTGPTVLTMPDLLADALDCVGERLEDWLTLDPVRPAYRARYADGSSLDVFSDVAEMSDEISRVCGPAEAAGYRAYVEFVSSLYKHEMRTFIDRNVDGPLDLVRPDLARIVALGALRRLDPKVGQYLKDERTRRVLSFQAMYAGVSPYQALAVYAIISYMDTVAGVSFPRGGMHAVPVALAGAAEKHGVQFRYGTSVSQVLVSGGRVTGVEVDGGERIPADVVVMTPDLPVAYRDLLGPESVPSRVRRQRYSPSCFLLLAGSTASWPGTAHHTITFGTEWRRTFREIITDGSLMSDPSFLVTNPTMGDPSLAPDGKHSYYVLFPTPNIDARLDWSVIGPRYREEVLAHLEHNGYPGFADGIEVEDVTTPADWLARGMERGTPFGASHTVLQTGPFRAGNLPRGGPEGLVFAGSGTVPGVGVPTVLISGRLAAERITGPDRTYRSRAWR
jgi:phytoene desaturase